ncbi:MAG: lysophospholipase [Flavobacteriaceae bacterium]
MKHSTFLFNQNNKNIFGQIWQPDTPKSVIVLVHGMGEHSSRYEDFVIPQLIKNDFVVIGFDQFGHGKSEGKRGHCPSYDALLNLIEHVIKKGNDLHPNLPVYLYGHSLGGNLVINYGLRKAHTLQGIVATSPYLKLAFNPPKWKLSIGKLLLKIAPSVTLPSELETDAISRDKEEVKRYIKDKLVHDKVSPMYTFPIMDAGEWAINNANKLTVPMLVLHGTGDRIIDHKASQAFCNNTPLATLKLFTDGHHELHHDICKDAFMDTILTWLKTN